MNFLLTIPSEFLAVCGDILPLSVILLAEVLLMIIHGSPGGEKHWNPYFRRNGWRIGGRQEEMLLL